MPEVKDSYTILICPKCGRHEPYRMYEHAGCLHDFKCYRRVAIRVVPATKVLPDERNADV